MKGRPPPATLRAYRAVTSAAAFLAPAWLGYRVRKGKEDARRLHERRGIASARRPHGALVWVHGASVGEVISVMPLIERLTERGYNVLLTSGTLTSSRIAARRAPAGVIHQFVPLDAGSFMRRFLDHWDPDLVLLAESELWPNLLTELGRRGTPVVLVNGRLSARSAERWGRLPSIARAVLSGVDLCLAQTEDDGRRFLGLGAPRVDVSGNLKFDVPPPPADPVALERMRRAVAGRPVFLAASTHGGEEEAVIRAHQRMRARLPGLLTIVAPRHPERGGEVQALASEAGLAAIQRSRGHLPDAGVDFYVADTIGELGLFYRVAQVVFMGGSLVEHGGQNPIEAAKLGAAVLHGPHVWNFGLVYDRLDAERGALPVDTADTLAAYAMALLMDHDLRAQVTGAADATVTALGGALERTLAAIEPYLIQIGLSRR